MDQEPVTPHPPTSRGGVRAKVAGALIGALAALSIGGVGLAFAQEAETPTTEAPAAETPAAPANPDDCPDKAGDAGGGGSDTADTADTTTDSGAEV
jgi:hypothetical protein